MGGGRSGNGGGARDNRNWTAEGAIDGYRVFGPGTSVEEVDRRLSSQVWEKNLTEEQKEALQAYTGEEDYFEQINNPLRTGQEQNAYAKMLGKSLDEVTTSFYLKENIVVHRRSTADLLGGVSTVEGIRKMFGKVVTDDGYTSTAAKTDFEKFTARPISYHIKTPQGKGAGAYVKNHSKHTTEYEFLFARGSSFKIVGAWADKNGGVHVNMEYVSKRTRKKK